MDIQICPNCKGTGKVERLVSMNFHDVNFEDVECGKCNGEGRVYVRQYTLTLPLNSKTKFHRVDEQLFNLIREAEKCQS
jgi:RecJ-like exonuclease